MFSARIRATIIVVVLVGGLACAGVILAAWLGPMSAHGTNVLHVHGQVTEVGPGKNFVFKTDANKQLSFVCSTGCRESLRHVTRHLKERAATDVYYTKGIGNELLVIDVD